MKQAKAEFPRDRLVVWAGKQCLVHLDASIGKQRASDEDGQATGEGKRESRSKIFHVDAEKSELLPSHRQYKAWSGIRKTTVGVMLLELQADEMTIHGMALGLRIKILGSAGTRAKIVERENWQFNCLWKAAMICYAVRSSFGEQESGRVKARWQTGDDLAESIPVELAVRPTIHGGPFSHGRVRNQKSKSVVKRM